MIVDESSTPDAQLQSSSQSASPVVPLRILFAVDSRFPGVGGAEIQSLKLANALRDRGVTVDFVVPYLDKTSSLHEEIEGFSVTKLDYPQIKLLGSVFLATRFAWYLYRHQDKYDSVHIHITRILAASAGFVKPFIKCVLVTKISGFFEFEGGILDQKKRFNPANVLIRWALRKIDYVQTISVQTREKLEAAGFKPEQISFIPNGIEIHEEDAEKVIRADAHAEHTFVIGYCGRMREVKGVHILLSAFAEFLDANPEANALLRIAGNGETEQDLHQQALDLKLGNRIDFQGYVSDTADFLTTLDLYVQPSFAEGLPNSVIEAMYLSRPVIATDIGGNNELVVDGESGLLFEAGNASALAKHITWCFQNRDRLVEMGDLSRQIIIKNYGFSRVASDLMELYRAEPGSASAKVSTLQEQ